MVWALKKVFFVDFSFDHQHLLLLDLLLLLQRSLFELQQRHALGNTYCMHMHNISMTNA
jgi:hypothetical protein